MPDSARAAHSAFFDTSLLTDDYRAVIRRLGEIARSRSTSVPVLALQWILRRDEVTSILLGASRLEQLDENIAAVQQPELSAAELAELDELAPVPA